MKRRYFVDIYRTNVKKKKKIQKTTHNRYPIDSLRIENAIVLPNV